MKKLLILICVLCTMTLTYGCKKNAEKADEAKDTGNESEVVQTEDSSPEITENASENAEKESSDSAPADVDVSDVEAPADITDVDTLEALIDEFNDPNTTPERKAELQILLGDFFDMMGGETVVISE